MSTQLPEELTSSPYISEIESKLKRKINAFIRYLKAKESGLKIVANENDCCDKCHDVDYEKTYPAHTATFFCANKDCPCHKESTHSEPKSTQCEMCQAVNELAPREAGEKAGYRKGVEAALEEVQTRVEGSWPEAIKAIKELIE